MKTNVKKYAGVLFASTVVVGGIASAAISPAFPTVSNTFAVAGQVIKSADVNKLAEAVNNLDKRAFQIGTSAISFLKSDGAARSAGQEFIVTDDGKVGIGTTTPEATLDIKATGGIFNVRRSESYIGTGQWTGGMNAFSPSGKRLGTSGFLNTNSNDDDPQGRFSVALDSNNDGLIVSSEFYLNVLPSGNVGIGTTAPSQKLHVNGSALATAWNTTSDERKKENIVELSGVLDKILQLRGVSFDWKSDNKHDLGVIAQEVEKVFPEFVTTDAEGWKSVDYSKLTAPLIEAVKEQQSQIATQKEEIELLKSRLDKAGL